MNWMNHSKGSHFISSWIIQCFKWNGWVINNSWRQTQAATYWWQCNLQKEWLKKIPTADRESIWNTPTVTRIVTQTVNSPSAVVRLLYHCSWNAAQAIKLKDQYKLSNNGALIKNEGKLTCWGQKGPMHPVYPGNSKHMHCPHTVHAHSKHSIHSDVTVRCLPNILYVYRWSHIPGVSCAYFSLRSGFFKRHSPSVLMAT